MLAQISIASTVLIFYLFSHFLNQKNFEILLKNREKKFAKILDTFNMLKFNKRKIMINVGPYGTYLEVHLLFLKEEQEKRKKLTFNADSDIVMKQKARTKIDLQRIEDIEIIEEEFAYTPEQRQNLFFSSQFMNDEFK